MPYSKNIKAEVNILNFKMSITNLILVGMFFMCGTVNTQTTSSKLVGVDTFIGVVKNVKTIQNNVFLVVSRDNDNKVYYSSSDREVSKEILKLKIGDTVEVKYVLGTPLKYNGTSAMPLSKVKFIK
jgi:hypothetical protein